MANGQVMRRNTDQRKSRPNEDKEMINLLNCVNLPVNPWFKYITDDDYDSRHIMQHHSDDDRRDEMDKRRKRKSGKKAR